jgi:hypothetical protein
MKKRNKYEKLAILGQGRPLIQELNPEISKIVIEIDFEGNFEGNFEYFHAPY